MADATPKKQSLGGAVIAPAVVAGFLLFGFGAFLGTFLGDARTIGLGLVLAWLAFTTGRGLAYYDLPKTRGMVVRKVLTGLAVGLVGQSFMNAVFVEGPGWPWTPWWALAAGFGFGLYRAHAPLLKLAREKPDDGQRVMGVFHRTDLEALGYLVGGYGLLGVALLFVFRPFAVFFPGGARFGAIAGAIYALHGARLLLKFASEERGRSGGGFVGWLKANALQNAIVVLVLVAYAVFRDELARSVPFFPLVEFGLGVAVFTFVLSRLRARMRRDGSLLATASAARDHERVVKELHEPDHEAVARPVARFIESGTGANEYAVALRESARLDDAAAQRILEPLSQHREPPRMPPLPLPWGMGAGAANAAGLFAAGIAFGLVTDAQMPYPLLVGVMLFAFGVYAQQDRARSHLRPGLAVGIAAAGVGLLLFDTILFFSATGALAAIPGIVWGIVAVITLLMLGIPALSSWRLQKRIEEGKVVDARRTAPARELAEAIQKARKRAATMTLTAFVMLLPLPWLVGYVATMVPGMAGFPEFLDHIIAVAIWVVAGVGASALLTFYGLTRNRPLLLAKEKEKRDRRLALHKSLIASIEKV